MDGRPQMGLKLELRRSRSVHLNWNHKPDLIAAARASGEGEAWEHIKFPSNLVKNTKKGGGFGGWQTPAARASASPALQAAESSAILPQSRRPSMG